MVVNDSRAASPGGNPAGESTSGSAAPSRAPLFVSWNPDVPEEVRASVEPYIRRWEHLAPTWIHDLRVAWDPKGDGASMSTHHEYRYARIEVTGKFLDMPAYERDDAVRHEFLHIPLAPLTNWTKDLIERLAKDDERLRDWLHSEWRERLEAAVVDLEFATKDGARA